MGLKSIVATRNLLRTTFDDIPPVFGFLGLGIEENPPEGLRAGEYFRVRPASDRFQFRTIFMEESAMAVQAVLDATMERVSDATIAGGGDWEFSMDGRVRFHLVFSLSDLVGSGLCIDIAYLIRALWGQDAIIFMHSVFSGLSETAGKRHAANAYATLLDLDYLVTNIDYSHPYRFVLPYDSFEFDVPPMDSFFLVGNEIRACEKLGAELYGSAMLSEVSAGLIDNIRQCMLDGSMDVEDKKAWITLSGSSSVEFPLAADVEQKERILTEAVNHLSTNIAVDEKGYHNAPYLIHRLLVAGPEGDLIVLQHEPRLNSILSSTPGLLQEYHEQSFSKVLLLQIDAVYPTFQVAGWDNDLAYESYDDVRPFHFDTSILERMRILNFSLEPHASIPEEKLSLWIKGRLLGLLTSGSDLPGANQAIYELMAQIDQAETENPDKTQAVYETVRHLSPEEFQAAFPCPEELFDAAYYYCTKEL